MIRLHSVWWHQWGQVPSGIPHWPTHWSQWCAAKPRTLLGVRGQVTAPWPGISASTPASESGCTAGRCDACLHAELWPGVPISPLGAPTNKLGCFFYERPKKLIGLFFPLFILFLFILSFFHAKFLIRDLTHIWLKMILLIFYHGCN